MEAAFQMTLDLKAGSPTTGKSVAEITNLIVDNLFGTSGNEMEQRVLARHRKDFQVFSEDWNDVAFTRQRIRWTQDSQNGPYVEVSQNNAIDELDEIPVERNTKEDVHCTPPMHTMYRILLGQINWLQSGTQFHCCYKMSRCASMQLLQQLVMLSLSTNWRDRSSHSQRSSNTGHLLDHYLDFLMPLAEIKMMALHREA